MSKAEFYIEAVADRLWAARGADIIESAIGHAVDERGSAVIALSGSGTPKPVFSELAKRELDWSKVTIVQVDERLVPSDSSDRNLASQRSILGACGARWLELPVDDGLATGRVPSTTLDAFAAELGGILAGNPLDLVHLGLGSDGHTASLVPGDPLVRQDGGIVGQSKIYQGVRRLTLTRSLIGRARLVLWLVRGEHKAAAVAKLYRGDRSIPASWIQARQSIILADAAAVALIDQT